MEMDMDAAKFAATHKSSNLCPSVDGFFFFLLVWMTTKLQD
jgi:hypothetical protein